MPRNRQAIVRMPAVHLALCLMTASLSSGGEASETNQIRETVQRSIPYIEEQGAWWIENKKCVSCHRVGTMIWSLSDAQKLGFTVDDTQLDAWIDWAIDASLAANDKGKPVGSGNREGLAQILLSFAPTDRDQRRRGSMDNLARLIAGGQEPDGSWKPGGQLPSQKRDKAETSDVSTMWLALALSSRQDLQEDSGALDKAMQRIAQMPAGKSTEWYVTRLLLARQVNDKEGTARFIDALLRHQRDDGGWGWLVDNESDALGTGMSLYALARSGVDLDAAGIKGAQRFLLKTQREDGSWPVRGTKQAKEDRVEETAVYWGTTWATLGLIASLQN